MSTDWLLGGAPSTVTSSWSATDGWHTTTTAAPPPSSRPRSSDTIIGDSKTIYLVFLAVLVLIVILALLLTWRRYRLRRRYWTATQLAISRGEPIPQRWQEDDPWGLLFPRPERWHGRKKERRWMRIPVLWDAREEQAGREGETESECIWEGKGQPLSVQSRLSPRPPPEPPVEPPVQPPQGVRAVGDAIRRGWRGAEPAPEPAPRPKEPKESERALERDEPVRVAVLVQMPVDPSLPAPVYDEEDEVGWRPGMELGVWEGHLSGVGEGGAMIGRGMYGGGGLESEGVYVYPPRSGQR